MRISHIYNESPVTDDQVDAAINWTTTKQNTTHWILFKYLKLEDNFHSTQDSIKKQFLNPVTAIQKTLIIRANITQNTLTHNYTTQTLEFQRNRQIKERIWFVFYVWIVSQLVAKSELRKEMCAREKKKKVKEFVIKTEKGNQIKTLLPAY